MSAGPEPQANVNLVEETRKQINRLFEEVARLAEADLQPIDFYGEFLKRILMALAAPAGAVWGRTAQGNLQLQFEINMRAVGLDATEDGRESHDELLRQAVMQPRQIHMPPHSSAGKPPGTGLAPGNPTDYLNLLVPIVVDNQVAGLIEVWQAPDRHPSAVKGFLEFMQRMAELATRYIRNNMLRQMVGQQQLWVQLEAFARTVHSSLNPTEVAYLVANEGRRLVECDRVSVGVRHSSKVTVEAISGADVVEKRSNLVQLMRALFDKVLKWGEKLVYNGTKDDTLPPDVLKALDAYLAESNSKLMVVMPLKDEREGTDAKKPARNVMMMECFEPNAAPEQLVARLEVVSRHATPALYNAVSHKRIPMRFVWMPLAKVQEGLGGKAKAIASLIGVGVIIILAVLVLVPYPLKMDATGQLLPEWRRWIYSPAPGEVRNFEVNPNQTVDANFNLVRMHDLDLEIKLSAIDREIALAQDNIRALKFDRGDPADRQKNDLEQAKEKATLNAKLKERTILLEQTNAEEGRPGDFWLKAPALDAPPIMKLTVTQGQEQGKEFRLNEKVVGIGQAYGNRILLYDAGVPGKAAELQRTPQGNYRLVAGEGSVLLNGQPVSGEAVVSPGATIQIGTVILTYSEEAARWTVLNADFKENLAGRHVRPSEPLLRIGDKENDWEIELKIPQKHIGQVLAAFEPSGGKPLDVDILVRSDPTRVFKGKLSRDKIAGDANPHKDDNNEAEPVVLATVRLSGTDIDDAYSLPVQAPHLLVAGTEVHAKVRCGDYRMGYSLFYGVWEFIYEKVVFFF